MQDVNIQKTSELCMCMNLGIWADEEILPLLPNDGTCTASVCVVLRGETQIMSWLPQACV
jgi:hypothetical protein